MPNATGKRRLNFFANVIVDLRHAFTNRFLPRSAAIAGFHKSICQVFRLPLLDHDFHNGCSLRPILAALGRTVVVRSSTAGNNEFMDCVPFG